MKIFILGNYDDSLIRFRGHLMQDMMKRGHEVVASAPLENYRIPKELDEMGVTYEPLNFRRTGMNPVADLQFMHHIKKMLEKHQPDVFFGYTVKPSIYGAMAARKAGVPHIYSLVTGLGYTFNHNGMKATSARIASKWLYKHALGNCQTVFFHNLENSQFFLEQELVDKDKIKVVSGSGVCLEGFPHTPVNPENKNFLLIARLLKDKGIREFLEAARIIHQKDQDTHFNIVGPADPNPTSFTPAQINQWSKTAGVTYHGYKHNVRPLINDASVYVLPSYHEGTPRTVLEAMASGRPIITTDTPGCRDTIPGPYTYLDRVKKGQNGLLIPVRDVDALVEAMQYLLNHPDTLVSMAHESRRIAEQKYDVRIINKSVLDTMNL